jgi:hypothetical protein
VACRPVCTSSSPWVSNDNGHTQSGFVIGALGGYQAGGATDQRSYAAVFDNDAAILLAKLN